MFIISEGKAQRIKKMLREYRDGKTCEHCGSAFDLTIHHPRDKFIPHKEKLLDEKTAFNGIVVLCRTCHELEDFDKTMQFYFRAAERRYSEKMYGWEKRWKLSK